MYYFDKERCAILEILTEGLTDQNPYKKIENKPGQELPVHVKKLEKNLFSIYQETKDKTKKIEMRFLRDQDGPSLPVFMQLDGLKENTRKSVIVKDGKILKIIHALQIIQIRSATLYLNNIKEEISF